MTLPGRPRDWRAIAAGAVASGFVLLASKGPGPSVALAVAFLPALLLSRGVVRRFGARHLLLALLPIEALTLGVTILVPLLALPPEVFIVDALLFGAAGALHVVAEARWSQRSGAPAWPAGVAPLLLAGLIAVAPGPAWVGPFLSLVCLTAASILRREPDSDRAGPTPLAPYFPWRQPDGAPPARLVRPWWSRAPATVSYLVVAAAAYAYVAPFHADSANAPAAFTRTFIYRIPELSARPDLVLVHLVTSVWVNWEVVQFTYVVFLLAIVGLRFEAREGPPRAITVFYASSIVAGLVAGALLLAIRPWLHAAWIDRAWVESWTGGSAGAFGLLGATAARCRRPWLLLAAAAAWEMNVATFFLRSYTPAFHLTAMATGYFLMRTWFRAPSRVPTAGGPVPRRL